MAASVDLNSRSCVYRQALATVGSSMISLCSGVTLSITSVMLPELKKNEFLEYDAAYDSWIASIATLSMILGSLCMGTLMDFYGRKATHIILSIPYIVGWACIAFADSITLILIGRFITGIAAGANKAIAMVYIGEITNPNIRAIALFIPGAMSLIGIVFCHLIGHYFNWKISAMIFIVPGIISFIAFLYLKESPLWLITKGRTEEGVATFRWFRGSEESSEKELKLVSERQAEEPKMGVKEALKTMTSLYFIKPMLILMLLMFETQFSGINVLNFYAQEIFAETFSKSVDPFMMVIASDLVRIIMALAICLFSKYSKKVLFLIASFGVSISLFGLIMWLLFTKVFEWVPVTCLMIYTCCSAVIVSVSWTFVPEVLPNNVRGLGSGINAAISYIFLFITVKITPGIMIAHGEVAIYGLFAASTFICGIITYFVLPETNGRTLQSIEDNYKNRKVETDVFKT